MTSPVKYNTKITYQNCQDVKKDIISNGLDNKLFNEDITKEFKNINDMCEKLFMCYQHGKKYMNRFMVLGDENIRYDDLLKSNVGILSTDQHKTSKQNNNSQNYGSVLVEKTWNIPKNDMFIIGAIEGQRSFHIACDGTTKEPIPKINQIWDFRKKGSRYVKRPRVLGRELLMIEHMNFQRIESHDSLGIILAPPSTDMDLNRNKLSVHRKQLKNISQHKTLKSINSLIGNVYENNCTRNLVESKNYFQRTYKKPINNNSNYTNNSPSNNYNQKNDTKKSKPKRKNRTLRRQNSTSLSTTPSSTSKFNTNNTGTFSYSLSLNSPSNSNYTNNSPSNNYNQKNDTKKSKPKRKNRTLRRQNSTSLSTTPSSTSKFNTNNTGTFSYSLSLNNANSGLSHRKNCNF